MACVARYSFFCLILLMCAGGSAYSAEPLPSAAQIDAAIWARDVPTGVILSRIERIKLRFSELQPVTHRQVLASEAETLGEAGHFNAAQISVAELLSAAEAAHDETDQIRAHVLRARISSLRGDTLGQLEAARLAVALASSLNQPALKSLAHQSLGIALFKHHQTEEAIRTLDLARKEARESKDSLLEGQAYGALARLNLEIYDNRRALQYIHEAQRLLRPQKQEWALAALLGSEAITAGKPEDGYESLPLLLQAYQRTHELGLHMAEQLTLVNLSDWHLTHRNWVQAIELSRRGLALSLPGGNPLLPGLLNHNLGQALFATGRTIEGLAYLNKAREVLLTIGQRNFLLVTLIELTHSYEQLGRFQAALEVMKEYRREQEIMMRDHRVAQTAELQERFDSERRQREIERLQIANQISASAAEHHKLRAAYLGILTTVLVLAIGAVTWLFRRAQRANAKLAAANYKLAYLAERDPLTNLFNRRAMRAWLENLPPASIKNPLGLVLLDVDHFKSINDRFGHETGDRVLSEISARLAALLREGDQLARWGGEEFLIALPGMAARDMETFVTRILDRIGSKPFRIGERDLPITASVGFCPFPMENSAIGEGWESHFMLADQAMYHAKGKGRYGASGVLAFLAPWETVKTACVRDFSAAIKDGLIEVHHWRGALSDQAQVSAIGARTPPA